MTSHTLYWTGTTKLEDTIKGISSGKEVDESQIQTNGEDSKATADSSDKVKHTLT